MALLFRALFFSLDFLSLFFCSPGRPLGQKGSQNGSQKRPKIDKKSIPNSILFWIPFWTAKNPNKPHLRPSDIDFVFKKLIQNQHFTFSYICIFYRFWFLLGSIFQGFGTPNWHFFEAKNRQKCDLNFRSISERFWCHFGPEMAPKCEPSGD